MNTREQLPAIADAGINAMAIMNDGAMMDRIIRFAEIMATGRATIPKELQNIGDCMAITMQALSWKMMPQAVAQKCFFLNGRIGYEAQLVAAAINNSGATVGNFFFEWFGPWEKVVGKFEIKINADKKEYRVPGWRLADEEGIGIKVWATLRGETEPRTLELLLAQARTRNSTQWADDPKQQLAYLAQKKWARLYAPGVILGVYTPDELEIPETERDVTPGANNAPQAGESTARPNFYPKAQFDKAFPKFKSAIERGEGEAQGVFDFIEGKGFAVTEEQRKAIESIKPAIQGSAQPVNESPSTPFTYAQVAEKLNTAADLSALDEAADLIGAFADEIQRAELGALYRNRRDSMAD